MVGGVVRGRDRGIVGEAAVDFIRQFKVDIAIIGISGIEDDGSLRDFDYREVKVSQTIISHAREVWLAADAQQVQPPGHGAVGHCRRLTACLPTHRRPSPFRPCWKSAGTSNWFWPARLIPRRSSRSPTH